MEPVSLSDIELYFSPKVSGQKIFIEGEECHHIKDVMRHKAGDEIFVADGEGHIYKTEITEVASKIILCRILERFDYPDNFSKITFCIPRLKSAERFEFALEKCVELGITNFIVFDSQRTVAKGEKIERWQKILTSAMKQSLRAWLPKISYVKSVEELSKLSGIKILFDQNSEQNLLEYISTINSKPSTTNYLFVFGPEGGFSEGECRVMNVEWRVKLTNNRLRSETAIVTAASLIAAKL